MRNYLKFSLFALVWALTILFGCGDEVIDDLIRDGRFKTTILNPSNSDFDNLYMNTATDFTVDIRRADAGYEEYRFNFSQLSGTGVLYYKDSIVKVGQDIICNTNQIDLKYIPTSQGDHKLKLNFENDVLSVSEIFTANATKLEFLAVAENLPKRPLVDKQFSFDLKLGKANSEDIGGQKFVTRATVLDGVGEIIIPTNPVEDNDTNTIVKPKSKIVSNFPRTLATNDKNVFYLVAGKNKISYIGNQAGRNVIQFNVENEYGYSQSLEVPIEIQNPDFSVKAVIDTIAQAGTINNFLLIVEDTDNHGANNYSLSYRNVRNTGSLKVNNNDIQVGSALVLQKGQNICEYIPEQLGEAELEFIVKDKYNTVKKDTAIFKVVKSYAEIKVTNYDSVASLSDASSFNFAISKKNYKGKYKYEILQSPVNSVIIKVNGNTYSGGKMDVSNPDNSLVTLIPSRPGIFTLKIRITDDYGSDTEKELRFNVRNTNGKIIVSNHNPSAKIFSATNFNFAVQKSNYTSGFRFEILSNPVNPGSIKINGTSYSGGKISLENSNNTLVTFTPSVISDVKFTIKVYDIYDGEISQDLVFSVSNTDIDISVKDIQKDLIQGKETAFKFIAKKPFYEGDLNYKLLLDPADAGSLKVNGQTYIAGVGDLNILGNKITNNAEVNIGFTPLKEGKVSLSVVVFDNFNGENRQVIPFTVSNPTIRITPSNFIANALVNIENIFNIAVEKPNYTGKFQYSITTTPLNAGKIKFNDIEYAGGRLDLTNLTNSKVSFTPSKEGKTTLALTVYDELGGSSTREFEYNVSNNPIKLIVSNQETGLTVDKPTNFNFAVSKEQYAGKFMFEITSEPVSAGSFKINGAAYSGGKTEIANASNTKVTFTPSKTGEVKLFLKVYDALEGQEEQELNFSVQNSDLQVIVSNLEKNIQLNKATTFNFSTIKQNYSGAYKYEILMSPADCGTLKVNSTSYSGGKVSLINPQNSVVEFISTKAGQNTLFIKVYDEQNGQGSETVIFNAVNPPIIIDITNKETSLTLNKETSFNAAISKKYYTGAFKYQIVQMPASAGKLKVNGTDYTGALLPVDNPDNLRVSFTPAQTGSVSLRLKINDELEGVNEEILSFNVVDPPIVVAINNPNPSLNVGETGNFSLKATKDNYTGGLKYEITPVPYNSGTIRVGGKDELQGSLTNDQLVNVGFTPAILGTSVLNIKATDDNGRSTEKQVVFSTQNTPIDISFPNYVAGCVLNQPNEFILKVTKGNYADTKKITYNVTPATTSGPIIINNVAYNGTDQEVTYGTIKKGIPVKFTPNREGECTLSFSVTDEFGATNYKSLKFNVANPELTLFLGGINTGAANDASLGETYKFTYNIDKEYYSDDFAYYITTVPANAGITATSDVTPRSARSGSGVLTGTIASSNFGVSTGEIRFTPNNSDFINQNITINVEARDKWNNKKTTTATFTIRTSAINVNIDRRTSIPVETPYQFYYTINKPGYSGTFQYTFIGWNDGDKLEVSGDASNWTVYQGGKFTVPSADHTYVRYTPAKTGTVPLKLFIYDQNGSEVMKECTFDVRAPYVTLTGGGSKSVYVEEFANYAIGASDEKGEALTANFEVDPSLDGQVIFNGATIANTKTRSAAPRSGIAVTGNNKLEVMSRRVNNYTVSMTASNKWGGSATVNTTTSVSEKPNYQITKSTVGQGEIKGVSDYYKAGSTATITAAPANGWKFVRWEGDITGSINPASITMNSDKTVTAIFEAAPRYTLTINTIGNGTVTKNPDQSDYESGQNVKLTANPAEGFEFVGWKGDASGTGAAVIAMNSNKSVIAEFKQSRPAGELVSTPLYAEFSEQFFEETNTSYTTWNDESQNYSTSLSKPMSLNIDAGLDAYQSEGIQDFYYGIKLLVYKDGTKIQEFTVLHISKNGFQRNEKFLINQTGNITLKVQFWVSADMDFDGDHRVEADVEGRYFLNSLRLSDN